ncbi:MAG: methanogen output domain 1-containing protein [Rivularia sp. ALOHA_DT_140]|nr:methanogen output domain 1-containing protein [Rivularia sp. ALOHA_DT_140]
MTKSLAPETSMNALDVSLESNLFLRTLFRELSSTLQRLVGKEEASELINVVGKSIGREIDRKYKSALQVYNLSSEQISEVLVDFKNRIQGDFYIIEESDEKIVFGNRVCPFAEQVKNRSSMCNITSSVFGSIAAENLGYAKVELQETIAQGNPGCRVVIYLRLTKEAENARGREYFK